MWGEQFTSLPIELWLRELGELNVWCEHTPDDVDERAVRRAYHLATLAPLGIRQISTPAIPLGELETLLDTGAIEEAARASIGANALIDLVHLPESGRWIASFSIKGDGIVRCQAPTAVRAIIRGWATYFTTFAN